jgi:hypothetical protein
LRRDGRGIHAWRYCRHLISAEQLSIITDVPLMSEDGSNLVGVVVSVPGKPAVEPQPAGSGVFVRQRAIPIDACHTQLMVWRRAEAR